RATPPRPATRSRRTRSRSLLLDAAGAVEPGARRRRLRGRVPQHHLDDSDVLLVARDEAVAVVLAAEAAVQGRAGAELHPGELDELPRREVRRERLHQVAAAEREPEEGAGARELAQRRLHDLLLAQPAADVGVRRVQLVLANARVDERTVAVHVHALVEAPTRPLRAAGR